MLLCNLARGGKSMFNGFDPLWIVICALLIVIILLSIALRRKSKSGLDWHPDCSFSPKGRNCSWQPIPQKTQMLSDGTILSVTWECKTHHVKQTVIPTTDDDE